jgi:hypothetical protein
MSTTFFPGVRIVDMPDLGAVTDTSSMVGEHAGSGRFQATALRSYIDTVTATGSTTPRTVQNRFAEAVNVKDYGAVGDGTTNDSPAFAAAVAALNTRGGGQLHIPTGRYRLNSTVIADKGNIHFHGDGAQSWIINGQANAAALQLGDGSTVTYTYRVSGLQFATAAGVVATAGNIGLRARTIGQSRFDNLVFTQYPAPNYDNISLESVSQSTFTSIFSQGAKRHGMYFTLSLDLYITNCRSDVNVNGFVFNDSQGCYCANMAGYQNTAAAFWLSYGTTGSFNMFFANCIGDTSGGSNWRIDSLCRSTFSNCWGSSQLSKSANTTAAGFELIGSGCFDLTFVGGVATYNNGGGVHLVNSAGGSPAFISLIGMMFGASGVGNGQSGTGYGLQIDGGCSHIKVSGGQARANVTGPVRNDVVAVGADIEIVGMAGYVSRNSGQTTLPGAGTSVVVNHGLAAQPNAHDVLICPTTALGNAKTLFVDTVTATSFTVHADVAPSTVSPYFNWSVRLVVD